MPAYNDEDFIEQMIHRKDKSIVNFIIIAANIVIFFIVEATGGSEDVYHMMDCGASFAPLIQSGEYYRLFTCMFLHFGFRHLFGNMLLLFFVGDYMERYLGKIKYLILYIGGGLCGNLLSYAMELKNGDNVVSAGASGAIFAVLGGLAVSALLNRGRLYELTFKRIAIMAALSLWTGFTSTGVDGFAHLGGFLGGGVIACVFVLPGLLKKS